MVNESIERAPSEIVQGFRDLLSYDSITCAISDSMGRFNAMTSDMRPLFEGVRLVGTAITVKTLAADLAAAFKAIDICQPGDIVVIDSHGSINTAFWGENMTMSALNRGGDCSCDRWRLPRCRGNQKDRVSRNLQGGCSQCRCCCGLW